jgi:hypothetical protein
MLRDLVTFSSCAALENKCIVLLLAFYSSFIMEKQLQFHSSYCNLEIGENYFDSDFIESQWESAIHCFSGNLQVNTFFLLMFTTDHVLGRIFYEFYYRFSSGLAGLFAISRSLDSKSFVPLHEKFV